MEDVIDPQSNLRVMLFAVAVLLFFFLFIAIFCVSWWLSKNPSSPSPYTGLPLRRASDISYYSAEKIILYMRSFAQYDNRVYKLHKAALCRETGRLFFDCVTIFDTIRVDWSFLQKRLPGDYVSWGCLTHSQQNAIRASHESLEGYNTDYSSPTPSPRLIEPEYVFAKPGPLYVNVNTNVLLGWKIVPGTDLEVLIVQKPKNKELGM